MAVVSVLEVKERRSGSVDRLGRKTYSRVFRVATDHPDTGIAAVRDAAGVPAVGTTYSAGSGGNLETDGGAFVVQIEPAVESEDGMQWLVGVRYEPYDAAVFPENPVDWPLRLSFGGVQTTRLATHDVFGEPVINSAFEPYENPIEVDDSRSTILVTRNERIDTFDFLLAEQYRDSVNDAAWNGFAARTVKCGIITTGEPQSRSVGGSVVWFYQVSYPFTIDRDTWDKKLIDQGYSYLDSSTPPKQVEIRDPGGQRPTAPRFLDGSGELLPTNGTVQVDAWRVYKEKDFTAFNMDFTSAVGRS